MSERSIENGPGVAAETTSGHIIEHAVESAPIEPERITTKREFLLAQQALNGELTTILTEQADNQTLLESRRLEVESIQQEIDDLTRKKIELQSEMIGLSSENEKFDERFTAVALQLGQLGARAAYLFEAPAKASDEPDTVEDNETMADVVPINRETAARATELTAAEVENRRLQTLNIPKVKLNPGARGARGSRR